MDARPIERYLRRHASISQRPSLERRYRYILTIPAFAEPADFLDRVLENSRAVDVLTIVTVNVPDDADPVAIEKSQALVTSLRQQTHVFVIDRVADPIPRRQGVGLARKLAADLACELIASGKIHCPLIFMTDADAVLPPDYFEAGAAHAERGTLLYPFCHVAGADIRLRQAAAVYELHLRHYVLGLRGAGSPYAYHSIGSTLAIHAATYAAVRGVPRRNGGEDFYLLNKAAKVDRVAILANPAIVISARYSQRVPFGTGPALQKMPDNLEHFPSYPPTTFNDLQQILAALRTWSFGDQLNLPDPLNDCLIELGWAPGPLVRQHPPGIRRWRAAMEWFDGFRTMRMIRARQRALPAAPLLDTLRHQYHVPGAAPVDLLELLRASEATPATESPEKRTISFTGVAQAVKMQAANNL